MAATGGGDVGANSLQESESTSGDNIGGIIGDLEGNGDMRLGSEIVNLIGEDCVEPSTKGRGIGEIRIMKLHSSLVGVVWIDVDVIDSLGVEVRGAANKAMDFVAFVKEEFSEVGTILAGDAGNQCHRARRRNVAISGCGRRSRSRSSGLVLGRHES